MDAPVFVPMGQKDIRFFFLDGLPVLIGQRFPAADTIRLLERFRDFAMMDSCLLYTSYPGGDREKGMPGRGADRRGPYRFSQTGPEALSAL